MKYLQSRAESQYWLPNHFKAKLSADQISYLHNGIEITLPKLSQKGVVKSFNIARFPDSFPTGLCCTQGMTL